MKLLIVTVGAFITGFIIFLLFAVAQANKPANWLDKNQGCGSVGYNCKTHTRL